MQSEPPAKLFGLAAEFVSPEEILRAAHQVREAGYCRAEVYTPFPVKGLAEVFGLGKTGIPTICLLGGILGAAGAFGMCWYANVLSYDWDVGGRPFNSWPAFLSIVIDVMIGGAFFAALGAMLVLNGLPRLNHPLFNVEAFGRATVDRYFLCIEATDERFDAVGTHTFLATLGATAVHEVPK
jgi:hypothetical protein